MFSRAPVLVLALTVTMSLGQDYAESYRGENRRRGSVDEDAGDYVYDYDEGNGLKVVGPVEQLIDSPPPPPIRARVPGRFKPSLETRDKNRFSDYRGDLEGKEACKSGRKTVAHETNCDLFYECYEGQGFLQTCPNGLVYSGGQQFSQIGVCDYPHTTDCGNKERNPPQSTEHCDWLYGIFGHETSCTRYWTCWNGTATEQFCIGGLLYNEETHACDWPQNVAGCQKHPLCKDDANGNVPLGKSCNRYWACQGGYPRLQRCPAMLVFDKNRRRCVTPPTEDCDVPTTSAPPPGEEGNSEGGFSGPGSSPRQSPNPRRGGGGRRQSGPRLSSPEGPSRGGGGPSQSFNLPEGLNINIPAGATPINQNN